jgi:hypothetical protein
MRGAVLALALALAAGPAAALSCLEPDARGTFWQHQDRPETFVAALGRFDDLRRLSLDRKADRELWRARFVGHTASARAFDRPFAAEVTIEQPLWTLIAGGGIEPGSLARWLPGATGIVYLQRDGTGYRLTAELCRGLLDTDPASIRPTLACLAGRHCPRPR